MISINGISFYFGSRPIYENASLHINDGEKIGLIGKNGTGKSTLLRLLSSEYETEKGSIEMSKDTSIGYFHQDLLSLTQNSSIKNIALEAFEKLLKQKAEIDEILVRLESEYSDDILNRLNELQDHFQTMGGYTMESKVEEVLIGLGFSEKDFDRDLDEFSGGWKMRVLLAKMLLQEPNLLMLDEPTNHLDLPSIEWLEEYIKTYQGAVVIVSHDQDFINNCVETIVEVSHKRLTRYPGSFEEYRAIKAERQELQQNAFENQQKKIKDTEKFINRFRAKATKARQVQSRIKALEKMDLVDEPEEDTEFISIDFPVKTNPGKDILNLNLESKKYSDLEVLKDSRLSIHRHQKIALIGANGKGKSTLLRILMEREEFEGELKLGHNVIPEFYAQHQLEALDLKNDILTELVQAGLEKTELEIRTVLGAFLFGGDDVFKKIKVLSGGEKSRVALAKTLLGDANFLLLDEPTNHLDIESTDILIDALQRYKGTFIIVSHNRHFISEVANEIWYFENKMIKSYPGTYQEFIQWQSKRNTEQKVESPKEEKQAIPKKNKKNKVKSNTSNNDNKIRLIESEIESLEARIDEIESDLSKEEIVSDRTKILELSSEHDKLQKLLDEKMTEWENLI